MQLVIFQHFCLFFCELSSTGSGEEDDLETGLDSFVVIDSVEAPPLPLSASNGDNLKETPSPTLTRGQPSSEPDQREEQPSLALVEDEVQPGKESAVEEKVEQATTTGVAEGEDEQETLATDSLAQQVEKVQLENQKPEKTTKQAADTGVAEGEAEQEALATDSLVHEVQLGKRKPGNSLEDDKENIQPPTTTGVVENGEKLGTVSPSSLGQHMELNEVSEYTVGVCRSYVINSN